MIHQQFHTLGTIRCPQQRQEGPGSRPEVFWGVAIGDRFVAHNATDDETSDNIRDALVRDVMEVLGVAFLVRGHGFPHGEGNIGPWDRFDVGFSVSDCSNEADVGGVLIVVFSMVTPGGEVYISRVSFSAWTFHGKS